MVIDLNADLGEGFDDDGLLQVVTSANVACGVHAGDDATMRAVCDGAVAGGVAIGAQVSYHDRAGFGRRPMEVPGDELADLVMDQILTLAAHARAAGGDVSYVKPHGALYHRVTHDGIQAEAVVRGITRAVHDLAIPLAVLGMHGSAIHASARAAGLDVVDEAFADRAYHADATLVGRHHPDAVITEPDAVVTRSMSIARARPIADADGHPITVSARSLCLHGDTPGAVELARLVRTALAADGVTVTPFARSTTATLCPAVLPLRVAPVGQEAVLIDMADRAQAAAMHAAALAARDGGSLPATDVVAGATTVLLAGIDPGILDRTIAEVRAWRVTVGAVASGKLVEIPARFDGDDIDQVASWWRTDRDGVAARLCEIPFQVAFSGFAPGFAYLTGLPAELEVPRLATPRTRVPAGTIGLAGPYAGIYPRRSPGGWQLVGTKVHRTGAGDSAADTTALWDPHRDPPALLTPGTTVRFIEVD